MNRTIASSLSIHANIHCFLYIWQKIHGKNWCVQNYTTIFARHRRVYSTAYSVIDVNTPVFAEGKGSSQTPSEGVDFLDEP